MKERLISAQANLLVKLSVSGRSQNEARTRQAIRDIREMFRKDGLL